MKKKYYLLAIIAGISLCISGLLLAKVLFMHFAPLRVQDEQTESETLLEKTEVSAAQEEQEGSEASAAENGQIEDAEDDAAAVCEIVRLAVSAD